MIVKRPIVARASEKTAWPISANNAVASPTAVIAVKLFTACPDVCEPITERWIAEGANAANNSQDTGLKSSV